MILLTVFTPAFNRAKTLKRLYESLKNQTEKDFEWLIVDDGSADNTSETVNAFIKDADFKIRYIYQQNSGKHVAFNNGVKNAEGELFFCIDSDDFAAHECVKEIKSCWKNKTADVSGVIAYKKDVNGKMLCGAFPKDVVKETPYNLNTLYSCTGEFSLIFDTNILKKFPFPEIKGEKFVTESVIYDKICQLKPLLLLDKTLTVCEYQPDGLSKNAYSLMLKNPTGYQIYYKNRIDMARSFKERFGYLIRYSAFYFIAENKTYKYSGKHKLAVFLTKPIGLLLKIYYLIKR